MVAASGSSWAATPAGKAVPYLEARINPKATTPFTVEEFDGAMKSVGAIHRADERGLSLFLARSFNDRRAPKRLHLVVTDGSTLEQVLAVVQACRTAGFTTVHFFGCLLPGCGIAAGATKDQKRHEGHEYKVSELYDLLCLASTYC